MQPDYRTKLASGTLPQSTPTTAEEAASEEGTYNEILKSSVLIGGSSVISTAIVVIRTKALALLLGPAGFGLISVYTSIVEVTRSVAGMGINNSGVRQIAEAVGSGDKARIARTVTVLRRVSVLLGTLGALLLFAFSGPASILSFGDAQHTSAVALLSLAVFFRLVADGQGALVQGMRRLPDLARLGILGALFGTIVSIPVVYFFREQGVVPYLVAVAAMSVVTSWWYSRKVRIQPFPMNAMQTRGEVASLLKFGFAFMASGLLMTGTAYAAMIIVLRNGGLESAGFYQAAMSLGGLYCAYIYQGIFADFYPRLVGVAKDNRECNRLVNQQTHVAMLLAAPGVVGTMTFASLVIALFYSVEFDAATDVLRWICLGSTFRVVLQPLGFIIVAKGEQTLFLATELAWAIVNVVLTWFCVKAFGLNGAGIAFTISYVCYGVMMYPIARRLVGFRWSVQNVRAGLVSASLIAVVFGSFYAMPRLWAIGVGTIAMLSSSVYSIRILLNHVSIDRIPQSIRWMLVRFGLVRSESRK